ncbi:MAG: hypothetical protein HRT90_02670, partial [Candidatus Margulisbacteria bacterium]|nr:hypothetical protein [Candidatus Margulisiibacteriota bacterium]
MSVSGRASSKPNDGLSMQVKKGTLKKRPEDSPVETRLTDSVRPNKESLRLPIDNVSRADVLGREGSEETSQDSKTSTVSHELISKEVGTNSTTPISRRGSRSSSSKVKLDGAEEKKGEPSEEEKLDAEVESVFYHYEVDEVLGNRPMLTNYISGLLHNRRNLETDYEKVQLFLLSLKVLISYYKYHDHLKNSRAIIRSLNNSVLFIAAQKENNREKIKELFSSLVRGNLESFLISSLELNSHEVGVCFRKNKSDKIEKVRINKELKQEKESPFVVETFDLNDVVGLLSYEFSEHYKDLDFDSREQNTANCGSIALSIAFQYVWATADKVLYQQIHSNKYRPEDKKQKFKSRYFVIGERVSRLLIRLIIEETKDNITDKDKKYMSSLITEADNNKRAVERIECDGRALTRANLEEELGNKNLTAKTICKIMKVCNIEIEEYFGIDFKDPQGIIQKLKQLKVEGLHQGCYEDYISLICEKSIHSNFRTRVYLLTSFLQEETFASIAMYSITDLVLNFPGKLREIAHSEDLISIMIHLSINGTDEEKASAMNVFDILAKNVNIRLILFDYPKFIHSVIGCLGNKLSNTACIAAKIIIGLAESENCNKKLEEDQELCLTLVNLIAKDCSRYAREGVLIALEVISQDKRNHRLLLQSDELIPNLLHIANIGTDKEREFALSIIMELSKSHDSHHLLLQKNNINTLIKLMVTGLEKEQEYATLAIFFLSLNKNSQLKLMSYSPLFRSIFFVAENGLEKAKEKAILVIATLSKDKKNHQ